MYRPSFKPSLSASGSDVVLTGHAEPAQPDLSSTPIENTQKLNTGAYYRYFVENITNNSIVEVTQAVYKQQIYNARLYRGYEVYWDTTFPILDYTQQGYVRQGSNTKNIIEVKKYSILFDYLATKRELLVENLQTYGDQYQTKDGVKYTGQYHIHPTEGPLTGAVHSNTPHRKLYDLGTRLTPYLTDSIKVGGKTYTELQNTFDNGAV